MTPKQGGGRSAEKSSRETGDWSKKQQGGGRLAEKAAGRWEIGPKKAGRREVSSREEGDGPKKAGRWETRPPVSWAPLTKYP